MNTYSTVKSEPCIENRPSTQVESATAQVTIQIDRLGDLVAKLETRIAGIVRMEGPVKDSPTQPPQSVVCPHADLLRNQGAALASIADSLESLLNRIEL